MTKCEKLIIISWHIFFMTSTHDLVNSSAEVLSSWTIGNLRTTRQLRRKQFLVTFLLFSLSYRYITNTYYGATLIHYSPTKYEFYSHKIKPTFPVAWLRFWRSSEPGKLWKSPWRQQETSKGKKGGDVHVSSLLHPSRVMSSMSNGTRVGWDAARSQADNVSAVAAWRGRERN